MSITDDMAGAEAFRQPPYAYQCSARHSSNRSWTLPIAIVQEHRSAFAFWCYWHANSCSKMAQPPELVTFDYHDDTGTEEDYSIEALQNLPLDDLDQLAEYAKRSLVDDGHIRPAIWLNCISNVHVILKDFCEHNHAQEISVYDRYGYLHRIYYYESPSDFFDSRRFQKGASMVLDIDLDFFTTVQVDDIHVDPFSAADVLRLIEKDAECYLNLLSQALGFTIALSPEDWNCGSFANSFQLLGALEAALFTDALADELGCRWNL